MNGKRKQHTADFKFKVALEVLKGLKTMSELASTGTKGQVLHRGIGQQAR
jgi:hypothetical protein